MFADISFIEKLYWTMAVVQVVQVILTHYSACAVLV